MEELRLIRQRLELAIVVGIAALTLVTDGLTTWVLLGLAVVCLAAWGRQDRNMYEASTDR